MLNVAIINVRDLLKNMFKISIIMVVLISIYLYFKSNQNKPTNINIDKNVFSLPAISGRYFLDITFPSFLYNINNEKEEQNVYNWELGLLSAEYKILDNIIKDNPDLEIKPEEVTVEDVRELARNRCTNRSS